MKNKGFTLVELLAVIVILAVIALIATPVVLNMITDTKENSAMVGANNYAKALEETLVKEILEGKDLGSGAYSIIGNTYTHDETTGTVEVKGNLPSSGSICVDKKGQVTSYVLNINGYTVALFDKKQEILTGDVADFTCDEIIVVGNDKINPTYTIKVEIIDKDENVIGEYTKGTYIGNYTKITINGKDSESKISKIEIISSKENAPIVYNDINAEEISKSYKNVHEGLNKITIKITDYAGNITTSDTLEIGQDFTTKIEAKEPTLKMGTKDYNFENNITVTYLGGGGTVTCDPQESKKSGNYDVTCTATPTNGKSVSTKFSVSHSYNATKVSKTCGYTCSNPSGCYSCDSWRSGTCCTYSCSDGVKREGLKSYLYNGNWNGVGDSFSGSSDCSYYTCPNGGKLSGKVCYYE